MVVLIDLTDSKTEAVAPTAEEASGVVEEEGAGTAPAVAEIMTEISTTPTLMTSPLLKAT